jgi:vacuolar-type H+-ATPase subunit E/Vma4
MKKEVKAFKNRDVPCKVLIDATKYLSVYNEQEGVDSCMGGIVMHAKKGRIVCSNTLDDRLALCY